MATLRRMVRERAGGRCEYCRLPQEGSVLSFHIGHIVPRQHGGVTGGDHLALACPHCNLHKGPNLTGLDPDTGQVTELFHPRRQRWEEHFAWRGIYIVGRTATGRTTVRVLRINSEDQLGLRSA